MPLAISRSLVLTIDQRHRLESLTRAHSTPQILVFRCRLILRAAAPERPTNLQIAAEMGCSRHTVGLWRRRFLKHGIAGLQDAPRAGRPRSFSPLGTG
jgi:hypothetical protein